MPAPTSPVSHSDLPEPARFAAALAREAGEQAMLSFRLSLEVEIKGDESPVTIADRAAERLMRDKIADRFPRHGIFGEEYGARNLDSEYVWVIDPIDGTRSFITGLPIWGTLLALARDGRPEIGVIEMPALRERWVGATGIGTCFEDARGRLWPAAVSGCTELTRARFYTTSLLYFDGAVRERVEAITAAAQTARFGGDCYIYGLLASGHIDLVVENRLQPYDFMATVPVIEGAGGVITDWSGRALHLESGSEVIAAATPELHRRALEMLAG